MIDFIRNLFCGISCDHSWSYQGIIHIFDPMFSNTRPVGHEQIYICRKCLKRKKIRF